MKEMKRKNNKLLFFTDIIYIFAAFFYWIGMS